MFTLGYCLADQLKSWILAKNASFVLCICDPQAQPAANDYYKILSVGQNTAWIWMHIPESSKNLSTVSQLYYAFIEHRLNRKSLIVAMGGGAATDTIGFAASTFYRGISWVCVPTTLLGCVDSCLGGKTGVNFHAGKNIIGSFHSPEHIFCDTKFLESLSVEQKKEGLAEAIKMGLLYDPVVYFDLTNHFSSYLELKNIEPIIQYCLKKKQEVVQKDPFDQHERVFLNFGHTIGHALERTQPLAHGIAVLYGMKAAILLSYQLEFLSHAVFNQVMSFFNTLPPLKPIDWTEFQIALAMDKKKENHYQFILLKDLGKPFLEYIQIDKVYEVMNTL